MPASVSPTEPHAQRQSTHEKLAEGLGYFSIALGLAELLMPRTVCRTVGMEQGHAGLIRLYGVREVATGVAILASDDPTPWVWGRVAGDVADIATVFAGARGGDRRTTLGVAALIGATALDAICATGLTAERSSRGDGQRIGHDTHVPDVLRPGLYPHMERGGAYRAVDGAAAS